MQVYSRDAVCSYSKVLFTLRSQVKIFVYSSLVLFIIANIFFGSCLCSMAMRTISWQLYFSSGLHNHNIFQNAFHANSARKIFISVIRNITFEFLS